MRPDSESRRRKLLPPPRFARRPLLASRRMFLRQIQIRGFKSFADKTVLEFIPGVSVIVGPNGSGKSNLVDAISWALGEQGARALRGGQMADVIFAGTPSRPALGMAEVKLVIDNSAGKIAVPDVRDRGQPHDLPQRRERVPDQRPGRAAARRPGAPVRDGHRPRAPHRRRSGSAGGGAARPSGGAPEVHRGGRRHREASPPQGARRAQALGARPGSPAPAGRAGGAPPPAEAAPAAGRDGQEARDAHRAGRGALAQARGRSVCGRCCASGSGARAAGTGAWRSARPPGSCSTASTGRCCRQPTLAPPRPAALADAEQAFRAAQADRTEADQAFRSGVERESAARENLAAEASRTARLDGVDRELARAEQELARVITELERREHELDRAEQEFRAAEEHRREIEDVRRRMGEEAAGRRAEMEALRRSLLLVRARTGAIGGRPARCRPIASGRLSTSGRVWKPTSNAWTGRRPRSPTA